MNTSNTDQYNYDSDSQGDACDLDDDNDGAPDEFDSEDNNPSICSDVDNDTCDDCVNGSYNTSNDGWDYDGDGLCDAGDTDDDNDGALDGADSNDNNPNICSDSDNDTCDDCVNGSYNTSNDGWDYDDPNCIVNVLSSKVDC